MIRVLFFASIREALGVAELELDFTESLVDVGALQDQLIAAHGAINTVSHHCARCDVPIAEQGIYCDPVTIEDDVWIGLRATILQGVTVGRGAIVGAGALVSGFDPNRAFDDREPELRRFNSGAVDLANDKIAILDHGYTNGQELTYRTDGAAIGGLRNGGIYYVVVVNDDEIM